MQTDGGGNDRFAGQFEYEAAGDGSTANLAQHSAFTEFRSMLPKGSE